MRRRSAGAMPFPKVCCRTACRLRTVSSRHRPCRPGARQGDDAAQAGLIVLELELATMQPCHRRGKAQPQPRARLRPALLKTHEALDDPTAVGLGNAGTVIGDAERNALA